MINPCTCTKRGGSSSSTKTKSKSSTRRTNSKPCKNCSKNPTIPTETIPQSETMLSSSKNTVGLDLPSLINWKTATRGRQRAVRRARTSFTGEINRAKIVTTSSNGSDSNGSHEEFKGTDQVPVSESEKFGVTILGRRFSDAIKNVPIKKRKCLRVTSATSVSLHDTALNAEFNLGEKSLCDTNQADFSGISILADAACETDRLASGTEFPVPESEELSRSETGTEFPVPESEELSRSETGTEFPVPESAEPSRSPTEFPVPESVEPSRSPTEFPIPASVEPSRSPTEFPVPESEEPSRSETGSVLPLEKSTEAHKDENGAADATDLLNNDGFDEPCKTENSSKDSRFMWDLNAAWECDEQDGFAADSELNGADVAGENENAVCKDAKEGPGIIMISHEAMNDGTKCEKAEVNEIEMKNEGEISQVEEKESIMEEFNVGQVELNSVDLNLLNQPAVLTDSVKDTENEIKPNDLAGVDDKMADTTTVDEAFKVEPTIEEPAQVSDLTNACDLNEGLKINLNDKSGPIELMDDKSADDSTQLNPSILAVVIENGSGSEPNDEALNHDQTIGESGAELCTENQNENGRHNNSDGFKENMEGKEEEYQYEDGELREPIIDYWAADEESNPKIGTHESEKQENHHFTEPTQNEIAPPLEEFPLPMPPVETDIAPLQIKDYWDDAETNEKPETDLDERPQRNGWALNGGNPSRVKRSGWDRLPESSYKNERDFRRDPSASSRPRSFARPRRLDEDEILDSRSDARPVRRRDEQQWSRPGPTRHKSPGHEFSAPSYAPSNSGNATAASIAKVKSNGFVVAPDGTLVKATGPSKREINNRCLSREREINNNRCLSREREINNNRCLSREREISNNRCLSREREINNNRCLSREREISPPAQRFHHVGRARDGPYRRPVNNVCSRRGGKVHVNVVHHHHLSPPVHVVARSRSRTRSPNAWGSRTDRARSPPCRAGFNHVLPHGARWVDERRCTRRSPPPRGHSPVLPRGLSPLAPRRQRGEEYLQHHRVPLHAIGYERRDYEDNVGGPYRHYERNNFNGGDLGFRPRNKMEFQRGFDRNYKPNKEGRNNNGFKFGRGRGRNNAGFSRRYDIRDCDGDDDDRRV